MKTDISNKCCFCIPLRKGLLCIGYLRLVICLVTIVQFTLISVSMFERMQDSYEDAVTFLKSAASIIPQLLDLIFSVTFIVAAHKKSLKLFDLYHLYCITMVLVYGLVVILVSCDMSRFNMLYYVMFQYSWYMRSGYYEFIAAGLIVLLLQTALTVLVGKEVCYLKAKKKAALARQRSRTSFRFQHINTLV